MTASPTGIASSVAGTGADEAADHRPARLLTWLGISGALTAIVLVGTLHVLAWLARAGSLGVALLGIWSAALLMIVLFPKHNWAPSDRARTARSTVPPALLPSWPCRLRCCR